MEVTPRENSIIIEFDCQFIVEISDSSLVAILTAYSKLLSQMLIDFIQKVLLGFGERAMSQLMKPFSCDRCRSDKEFIWKTRHGKETKILTVFQWVKLQKLQGQCKGRGHKFYITRKLLGIEPMKQMGQG